MIMMKNLIYIILITFFTPIWGVDFSIIEDNSNAFVADIEYGDLSFSTVSINGEEYKIPNVNGLFHNETLGHPNLPQYSFSIHVPLEKQAQIHIDILESQVVNHIDIAPSKGVITRDKSPQSIPYEFATVYDGNRPYPSETLQDLQSFILRGLTGERITITPFSYIPQSKHLTFFKKLRITIDFVDDNTRSLPISSAVNPAFSHLFNDVFSNNYQLRYDRMDDDGKMLIITTDEYIEAVQPLQIWKNQKGIETSVVSVNDVGQTPEAIKSYILNEYIANDLTFVLFVGNTDDVPTFWSDDEYNPSDPTYGYLDGDDAYPEVFVGRFSANSQADINTQVQRVLRYERYVNENATWYQEGIGIASSQGEGQGDDGEADFEHIENIRQALISYNYTNIDQAYDIYGTSESDVYDAVNSGRGIINYAGHGSVNSWISSGFSVEDINALENIDKYPFIVSVSCRTGASQFGESMAEAWLNASDDGVPTGAINVAASSTLMQWAPPMECQDEFNEILTESYEMNQLRSFSGIFYNSTLKMIESYGANGVEEAKYWHVYGDPSIMVRTDSPEFINTSHDEYIINGQSNFIVYVDEDELSAALSVNGELLATEKSFGGIVNFDLSTMNLNDDHIILILSGYNKIPYESTIQIIESDTGFITVNDVMVNGQYENYQAHNGEILSIHVDAQNQSIHNFENITVSLESTDEFVTLLTPSEILNDISINDFFQSELSIKIHNDIEDGHVIQLHVKFESSEEMWVYPIVVEVYAPELAISTSILQDENEDGVWDSGEIATLSFVVSNLGMGDLNYPLHVEIISDEPLMSILNESLIFDAIQGGDNLPIFIDMESFENIPLGTELNMGIHLSESGCIEHCIDLPSFNLQLNIGNAPVLIWNPSGNSISATKLTNYFMSNGFGSYDYVDVEELPNTAYYHTAFVLLGIYPENYQLSNAQSDELLPILQRGGNVYLEGGDTWYFDEDTQLHEFFNINAIADGASDLSTIIGVDGTFAEGLSFEYNGSTNWIDRLAPLDGAYSLLKNENPNYTTAVYYQSDNGYKTIGASHELGGLSGEDFSIYVDEIVNFFQFENQHECMIGDVNNDSDINVLDVVRMVNIILNNGEQESVYELCAADVNGDGNVNVIDVVTLMHSIINA